MEKRYKYIHMVEVATEGRKTKIWAVMNNNTLNQIGHVKWYPGWRQYRFEPWTDTVYSAGCLDDIASFISQAMSER